MKAALHVATERRHLTCVPLVDGSPVISESCSTSHSPHMSVCGRSAVGSCGIRMAFTHSSKPSRVSLSVESDDFCRSVYQPLSRGRIECSAERTELSRISLPRNAAEFSRLARGSTRSLSISESAIGTGMDSSLSLTPSPSLSTHSPKSGLARQKAMRTSMLRNS